MELADQYTSIALALKDLAKELRIRNPAKLLKIEQGGIPAEAVHREKKATNDIAVVDRAMQQIKTDQAGIVANGDARNWEEALPLAIDAHNKRPHSAVFGSPTTVESRPKQKIRARRGC